MLLNRFVLVRTLSAGIHMGTLVESNGTAVLLKDCRRLWKWTKAFSLNEIANHGCGEDSRISEPTELNLLTQAIEVLLCTQKAQKNLTRSRNGV